MATDQTVKERKKPPRTPPPPPKERQLPPWLLGPATDGNYTIAWIAAWVVFLAILAVINRTKLGHAALYHGLILAVLLLVAGQYRRFAELEQPITGVTVPK